MSVDLYSGLTLTRRWYISVFVPLVLKLFLYMLFASLENDEEKEKVHVELHM